MTSTLNRTDETATTDDTARLGISTIASAHSPTIHRDLVPAAMDLLRRVPEVAPIPTPDQSMLDQIVAAAGGRP